MPVNVIDTLKPKNNGEFAVVEAVDVAVSSGKRLPAALAEKADASALAETNTAVQSKANASDVETKTANLQAQINSIITPVTQDAEVQNARTNASGTTFTTLKTRLDASDTAVSTKASQTEVTGLKEDLTTFSDVLISQKNCFYGEVERGTINSTTGEAEQSNNKLRTHNFLTVKSNGENNKVAISYSLNEGYTVSDIYIAYYGFDKTLISYTRDKTIPANCNYIKLIFHGISEPTGIYNIQVEYNATGSSTTYEPYKAMVNGNRIYKAVELIKSSTSDLYDLFDSSKNYYNTTMELGDISSGTDTPSTSRIRTAGFIKAVSSKKFVLSYVLDVGYTAGDVWIHYYNSEKEFISATRGTTVPDNCYYIRFVIRNITSADVIHNIQVEYNDTGTSTDYQPYSMVIKKEQITPTIEEYVPKIDRSDEIVVISDYRITNSNPYKADYHVGENLCNLYNVKQGDKITLTMTSAASGSIVPISEKVGDRYHTLVSSNGGTKYTFVAPYEMDITVCTQRSKNPVVTWVSNADTTELYKYINNTFHHFAREKYGNIISAISSNTWNSDVKQKPITLLHFSDMHGGIYAISGAKLLKSLYGDYINDAIVTGDLVSSKFTNPSPDFTAEGCKNIMVAIGNHDVYDHNGDAESHGASYDDKNYWATATEKYNKYLKPTIANWNVVQPPNAEQDGLCYYYKDYDLEEAGVTATVAKLRLIVIDAMAYDLAQRNWLSNTLDAARTNGYAVVIANHFPPTTNNTDTEPFETNFASYMRGMEYRYADVYLKYGEETATDLVDSFINNGGEFVCWICGHLHYGMAGTLKSHPNQIYIAIETANRMYTWNDMTRNKNDESAYLYNLIAFDTYNKLIKVARIGAEYDTHFRHRGTLVIDYANKSIVSTT